MDGQLTKDFLLFQAIVNRNGEAARGLDLKLNLFKFSKLFSKYWPNEQLLGLVS